MSYCFVFLHNTTLFFYPEQSWFIPNPNPNKETNLKGNLSLILSQDFSGQSLLYTCTKITVFYNDCLHVCRLGWNDLPYAVYIDYCIALHMPYMYVLLASAHNANV